jgi:hypothetical protein
MQSASSAQREFVIQETTGWVRGLVNGLTELCVCTLSDEYRRLIEKLWCSVEQRDS